MTENPFEFNASEEPQIAKKRKSLAFVGVVLGMFNILAVALFFYHSLSTTPAVPPVVVPITSSGSATTEETATRGDSSIPKQTKLTTQSEDRVFVTEIVDGDTIEVETSDGDRKTVRLNGIDCPEHDQPFGTNASAILRTLIKGKRVRIVEANPPNERGHIVANVYLPQPDKLVNLPDRFVNRELVRRGLAWHDMRKSTDQRLASDELHARSKQLGIWSGTQEPIPPWDWCKLNGDERVKHK